MKHSFFLLVLSFVITSCSSVKVRFDQNVDFQQYNTFAYVKDGISRSKLPTSYKKALVYEVDRFLKNENLHPDKNRPDLLVIITPDFHKRIDIYDRVHFHGRHVYKEKSLEGRIKIKLLDARANKKVWEGAFYIRAENSAQFKRLLRKKLKRLAEKYPPR